MRSLYMYYNTQSMTVAQSYTVTLYYSMELKYIVLALQLYFPDVLRVQRIWH